MRDFLHQALELGAGVMLMFATAFLIFFAFMLILRLFEYFDTKGGRS